MSSIFVKGGKKVLDEIENNNKITEALKKQKMIRRKRIKITETQLKRVVSESVKRIIKEEHSNLKSLADEIMGSRTANKNLRKTMKK